MKRISEFNSHNEDEEKISYKPIPVRELLIELKDTSELMLDLAYSSILFDDEELAEEVLELEKRMDYLVKLLQINCMAASRSVKDAENLLPILSIASAIDKISDAAGDLAIITLKKIKVHPLVREAFSRASEKLTCIRVKTDSELAGTKIGGSKILSDIGVDIIAIRRGKNLIVDPDEDDVIIEGDVLYARGTAKSIEELEEVGEEVECRYTGIEGITPKELEEAVKKLVELKDTSELMLDLAYSSILLGSSELAEEVLFLEEYMDEKHTEFELYILSMKPMLDDTKGVLGLIRMSLATEEIADAAAKIADTLISARGLHPVLKKSLEEADEVIVKVDVPEGSPIIGKTLKEISMQSSTGVWIVAIMRDGRW
ncbi:MAG: TrkA C-terminal domain-containing protein, partial [Candidatus Bathyarchaeia archaeon]